MIAAPVLSNDRPDLPARCYLERAIVANLIAHLQAKGFSITSASDGEERQRVEDAKEAMEILFSVDEAWLYVRKEGAAKSHVIFFVFGNGEDCIADMSMGPGFSEAMDSFTDDVLPGIVSSEGLHKALAEAQAECERLQTREQELVVGLASVIALLEKNERQAALRLANAMYEPTTTP